MIRSLLVCAVFLAAAGPFVSPAHWVTASNPDGMTVNGAIHAADAVAQQATLRANPPSRTAALQARQALSSLVLRQSARRRDPPERAGKARRSPRRDQGCRDPRTRPGCAAGCPCPASRGTARPGGRRGAGAGSRSRPPASGACRATAPRPGRRASRSAPGAPAGSAASAGPAAAGPAASAGSGTTIFPCASTAMEGSS